MVREKGGQLLRFSTWHYQRKLVKNQIKRLEFSNKFRKLSWTILSIDNSCCGAIIFAVIGTLFLFSLFFCFFRKKKTWYFRMLRSLHFQVKKSFSKEENAQKFNNGSHIMYKLRRFSSIRE